MDSIEKNNFYKIEKIQLINVLLFEKNLNINVLLIKKFITRMHSMMGEMYHSQLNFSRWYTNY